MVGDISDVIPPVPRLHAFQGREGAIYPRLARVTSISFTCQYTVQCMCAYSLFTQLLPITTVAACVCG